MLNVAIVGVSHWHTPMHVAALHEAGARITAIADARADTLERVGAETGAAKYDNLDSLLDDCRPELILVMGKPEEVLEAGYRVVRAGIPAIVEKPIGLSGVQAADLAREASRGGTFVTVPLVNRYSELWIRLDRLVSSGGPGQKIHAHFRVVNGPPGRYERMGVGWMLDPAVSGGGPLRNLGIHPIDAFLQFVGDEDVIIRASALRDSRHYPGLEEFATVILESASGVIGTIETGYSLAAKGGSDTEWRVATTKAYLVDRNQSLRIALIDEQRDETIAIPSVRDRYDSFARDTLERVRDGRPPKISLSDYVRASLIIDEVYERHHNEREGTST